ncbi:MAG: LPS export ABC transporter periplasmic protein LptC [bacterium]|nr:LPS export ABC transporter periplasmic protein LptC [bacterium]
MRKALKIFIVIALVGIVIYIFTGLKNQEPQDHSSELTADGEKMIHATFDKKHKKVMELKCSTANKETDDKTIMQNIEGVIFKKGRMNQDIQVFGDDGYVANDAHNFFIENNARIVAETFKLRSRSFLLEDQAELETEKKVHYETENLKGVAREGMKYYLKLNVLKLFKTRGHYNRNDRDFQFKTDVLWLIDQDNMMVMEKDAVIKEKNSILRSGWISVQFTDGFKRIVEAASQVNSYFYLEDPEKKEIKEIKSDNITSYYDDHGKLSKVSVLQNGEILLKNETNHTMIASDAIHMNFNVETGKLTRINIPSHGQVENTGKSQFRVSAESINADYNEAGDLVYCEGKGNCDFIIDEYRGLADTLLYNIEKKVIALDGPDAKIINGDNTFNSVRFTVNTEKKILSSNRGVKSVILLRKQNVLFKQAPIFINSQKFTIFEKENRFSYEQRVSLLQGDISLTAGSLEIRDDNDIEIKERVLLSFKSDDKEISIRGDRFVFNAGKRNIEISGNPVIKNDENILKADYFVIQFSDQNALTGIYGDGDINFTREDLSGTSGKVDWLFTEDTLVLKDLPQIMKKNGGTTMGDELKINLKTNKITILSSATERTETLIK